MSEELSVSDVIPAAIDDVFEAFLDSALHTAMTGGQADVSARVGEDFTAWDGYIRGTNLELERPTRIVQRWRASDFPEGADHSHLEILLSEKGDHTEITFVHSNLPDGMGQGFAEGWMKFYILPMKAYFETAGGEKKPAGGARAGAAKKSSAKRASAKRAAPKKPAKPAAKKARPAKAAPKKAAKKAAPKRGAAPKKAVAKKATAKKPAAKKKASKRVASK